MLYAPNQFPYLQRIINYYLFKQPQNERFDRTEIFFFFDWMNCYYARRPLLRNAIEIDSLNCSCKLDRQRTLKQFVTRFFFSVFFHELSSVKTLPIQRIMHATHVFAWQ